jgi:hypothetical protein
MPKLEKPENPEDLIAQVSPAAGDKKEELPGQQGGPEKKCPYCKGAKTFGTPTECQMCGGSGVYAAYAARNL